MPTFELKREAIVPRPLPEVFEFFSRAENLERITPPHLRFRILTELPIRMEEGALIEYRLRLYGVPLRWTSRISVWEPPHRFVDEQVRGPYKLWIHEHSFEARGDATLMRDHVRYAVRGGRLVDRLFVRRDVEKIFAFRQEELRRIFPDPEAS